MKHYIIVRRDLQFLKGKKLIHMGIGSNIGVTAAQVTHAAGESFAMFVLDEAVHHHSKRLKNLSGTIAVVLGVPNERALKAVEKKLLLFGIRHVAVREPDEPWNGQLMAIGLWPREHCNQLRRLKLL
jgi:peptidyl-tRNA hydrolase